MFSLVVCYTDVNRKIKVLVLNIALTYILEIVKVLTKNKLKCHYYYVFRDKIWKKVFLKVHISGKVWKT